MNTYKIGNEMETAFELIRERFKTNACYARNPEDFEEIDAKKGIDRTELEKAVRKVTRTERDLVLLREAARRMVEISKEQSRTLDM